MNAVLFSQMGYEAMILGRIGDHEREIRSKQKDLEFNWQPQFADHSSQESIFVSYLYHGYQTPLISISDQYLINVTDEEILGLNAYFHILGQSYKTSHILVPMTDDFAFVNAQSTYKLIDKIIEINKKHDSGLNLFYSTVQNYVDSVKKAANESHIQWPRYTGDFFPLMTEQSQFWSGYFSSRPEVKRLIA